MEENVLDLDPNTLKKLILKLDALERSLKELSKLKAANGQKSQATLNGVDSSKNRGALLHPL